MANAPMCIGELAVSRYKKLASNPLNCFMTCAPAIKLTRPRSIAHSFNEWLKQVFGLSTTWHPAELLYGLAN